MNMRNASHATWARWALLLALSFSGWAMAQSEPTLDQVYQAAQAGRVEQALEMMQPVLKAHPGSAKAHFVEAELLARQGQAVQAREQLAQAERLAPGLPFAKTESVQSLQRALAAPQGGKVLDVGHRAAMGERAAPASGSSMPWGVLLAVGGGALVAWMLMRLGRPAPAQTFSSPAGSAAPVAGQGWAVPGMNTSVPASGMPMQSTGGGLGSQLAGGLATGLAVGAGVVAAESIGRSLFGGAAHAAPAPVPPIPSGYDPVFGNTAANPDMGGNDFGVNDAESWDDGATGGGSSDWDT